MRPIGSTSLVMLREDCVCNMVGIRETKINDDGSLLLRDGGDLRSCDDFLDPR